MVNFGYIENRQIEQVKGVTYSLDALLGGTGPLATAQGATPTSLQPTKVDKPMPDHSRVDEEEFANVNGIEYTLEDLIGGEGAGSKKENLEEGEQDATIEEAKGSSLDHAAVALDVGIGNMPWTVKGIPKPGNKMFFAVVYLAPGDYHRCALRGNCPEPH